MDATNVIKKMDYPDMSAPNCGVSQLNCQFSIKLGNTNTPDACPL